MVEIYIGTDERKRANNDKRDLVCLGSKRVHDIHSNVIVRRSLEMLALVRPFNRELKRLHIFDLTMNASSIGHDHCRLVSWRR